MKYGTFLGSPEDTNTYDEGKGVSVDDNQNVYVVGNTSSKSMFIVNNGVKASCISCTANSYGFLITIDTKKSGISSQIYGTYLGGDDGVNFATSVASKNNGIVYAVGTTNSSLNVPITNTALYPTLQGTMDAYLVNIDVKLFGAAGLKYGTYIGGNDYTEGTSVTATDGGVAYVAGRTTSSSFEYNALDGQYQGGTGQGDAYMLAIDTSKSGSYGIVYGTYLGGTSLDFATSIAIDTSLNVYVAGYTTSDDYPTKNAYQSTLQGSRNAFLTKIGPLNISLELSKETCKCIACVGEKIPYTIKIKNNGTDSGRNIVVSDTLPLGVYVNSMKASYGDLINNNNNIIWNIPYLAPGSSVVANIVVTPTESICYQQEKNIINVSEISSINGTTITNLKDSAITHIECYCNCKKC